MKVLITGTPGTGKTLVADELGKLTGWEVLHITEVAEEAEAVATGGNGEGEVDVHILCAYLTPILQEKQDVIFEGHLGCEIPCPADLVVVLRTNPEELEKRMQKRGYTREKIDVNLMAELLDYCYQVSEWYYSCDVVELDTSGRSAQESARRIYDYLEGNAAALDSVSWEDYLKKKTGKPEEQ